jgi:hypothetical protein
MGRLYYTNFIKKYVNLADLICKIWKSYSIQIFFGYFFKPAKIILLEQNSQMQSLCQKIKINNQKNVLTLL